MKRNLEKGPKNVKARRQLQGDDAFKRVEPVVEKVRTSTVRCWKQSYANVKEQVEKSFIPRIEELENKLSKLEEEKEEAEENVKTYMDQIKNMNSAPKRKRKKKKEVESADANLELEILESEKILLKKKLELMQKKFDKLKAEKKNKKGKKKKRKPSDSDARRKVKRKKPNLWNLDSSIFE